jgi:hypothetical protein
MERVLEILLEVENLTVNERVQVEDGLAFIRSDKLTNTSPDSEVFSDLSALISIRYRHQSEEEARAVRVARERCPARAGNTARSAGLEQDGHIGPHRPNAAAPEDSERRQLAKRIHEIIKANTAVPAAASTAGLNRRTRWTTADKVAAGSTLPLNGVVAAAGNTANAQATARKAAQAVGYYFSKHQLEGLDTEQCVNRL